MLVHCTVRVPEALDTSAGVFGAKRSASAAWDAVWTTQDVLFAEDTGSQVAVRSPPLAHETVFSAMIGIVVRTHDAHPLFTHLANPARGAIAFTLTVDAGGCLPRTSKTIEAAHAQLIEIGALPADEFESRIAGVFRVAHYTVGTVCCAVQTFTGATHTFKAAVSVHFAGDTLASRAIGSLQTTISGANTLAGFVAERVGELWALTTTTAATIISALLPFARITTVGWASALVFVKLGLTAALTAARAVTVRRTGVACFPVVA